MSREGMPRILLVEDEAAIARPLGRLLAQEGYAVLHAPDAKAAASAMREGVDLVILDWMLPDGQGIDLLRSWRATGHGEPVIFLTARHELVDKVLGFELGADDYLTKPFEARELLARIKARLRTKPGAPPTKYLSYRGVKMDVEAHVVTHDGVEIELARMEYQLLKLFLENLNKVFTRDEILNLVWGFDSFPTTRTVDTHVLQLRQKLKPEYFETVRGVGYRLARTARAEELTKN